MIPVNSLHYAFLQQGEATDSRYIKEFSTVQRDYYLNRAKDAITETYAKIAENNSTIADYLIDITVRGAKLESSAKTGHVEVKYPEDYYHTLSLYVDASKKGCTGLRRFPVRRLTSDKVQRALKNANVKRFWDFEETVAIQSSTGYNVYTEEGLTYDVYLDYIKKIPNVAAPQFEETEKYILADGTPITQNRNLEINNIDLFHKIVSVAVLLTKRDRGQAPDYEMQYKTLINIDTI